MDSKIPPAAPPPKKRPKTAAAGRRTAPQPAGRSDILPYALLSLGCFLCGLVLVGLLLWKAELLVRLGLTGNFYYLVLLPLGLAVAGFLFGAMRSFARYRGEHFGGTLELGGPIVGFVLVVLGGFLLPPPAANFPLTVYVHGPAGPQDLVKGAQGSVLLYLGTEPKKRKIEEDGQAFFQEIPANFRGQKVNVGLDADGYELAEPGREYHLDGTSLYLPVRRKPVRIFGGIQDDGGNPIAGARISIEGFSGKTNQDGHFDLALPGDLRSRPGLSLLIVADGYEATRVKVTPDSNPVIWKLKRQP